MDRRVRMTACFVVGLSVLMGQSVLALQLLSKEEGLKKMLPGVAVPIEEKKAVTPEQAKEIADTIKTEISARRKAEVDVTVQPENAFYFDKAGADRSTAVVIVQEPGKWGPVEFIVALEAKTGKVLDLAVMSYTEKRGRPIARHNFLKQFIGHSIDEPLLVGKGIRPITGATISSWATAIVVRKAQLIYKAMYLK